MALFSSPLGAFTMNIDKFKRQHVSILSSIASLRSLIPQRLGDLA